MAGDPAIDVVTVAPAVVRRRAREAAVLLRAGPGPDAERTRELAALLAPHP